MEYKYYDWNNLIDENCQNKLCSDVANIIHSGKFWHNSPKYQTNINVFGQQSDRWTNLKMSFIWSCFAFLSKDVQIKNIQSWSFMTSLKYPEERDTLWHHHNHNPQTKTISGIFYLHLPEGCDKKQSGTEMAPNGVEGDGKFFCEWRTGNWLIYPGSTWHRPGILESKEDRYIVAADLEF